MCNRRLYIQCRNGGSIPIREVDLAICSRSYYDTLTLCSLRSLCLVLVCTLRTMCPARSRLYPRPSLYPLFAALGLPHISSLIRVHGEGVHWSKTLLMMMMAGATLRRHQPSATTGLRFFDAPRFAPRPTSARNTLKQVLELFYMLKTKWRNIFLVSS